MLQSTPQASVLTSSPASEETLSRKNSAPCRRAMAPTASAGYVEPVEVSLWTSVRIFGLTRSTSFSRRPMFRGCPHSTENSVTWAPTRLMISRISTPNCPATMTRTRSPGSTSEIADVSRAVRPEPGMMMTSPSAVWKTWRRARVVGSRMFRSKFWSYWIMGGWFMAWMTGHGSSVGPGIMRIGRLFPLAHRMNDSTIRLRGWRPALACARSGTGCGRTRAGRRPVRR